MLVCKEPEEGQGGWIITITGGNGTRWGKRWRQDLVSHAGLEIKTNPGNSIGTESRLVAARGRRHGRVGSACSGCEASFWGDKNITERDSDEGHATL